MRQSTAAWFAANAETLSLDHSLRTVLRSYEQVGERRAREATPAG